MNVPIGTHVRGVAPGTGKTVVGYYYGTTRHGLHIVYGERWSGDPGHMPHHQSLLPEIEQAPEEEKDMPLDGVEKAAAAVRKGRTSSQREDVLTTQVSELSKRHKKGRGVIREAINIRVAALEEQARQERSREKVRDRANKAPAPRRGGATADGAAFQAVLDKHKLEAGKVSAAAQRGELFIDQPVSNRYIWLVTHKGGSTALLEKFAAAVAAYAKLAAEAPGKESK
jgi:hypothetical protein